MTDIVAFLTARLDEDQAAANDSYGVRWTVIMDTVIQLDVKWWNEQFVGSPKIGGWIGRCERSEEAAHIVRHDPARVLAEVAAKRAILELHNVDGAHECPETSKAWGSVTGYETECLTLRLLALPDADHPDYEESWKP